MADDILNHYKVVMCRLRRELGVEDKYRDTTHYPHA